MLCGPSEKCVKVQTGNQDTMLSMVSQLFPSWILSTCYCCLATTQYLAMWTVLIEMNLVYFVIVWEKACYSISTKHWSHGRMASHLSQVNCVTNPPLSPDSLRIQHKKNHFTSFCTIFLNTEWLEILFCTTNKKKKRQKKELEAVKFRAWSIFCEGGKLLTCQHYSIDWLCHKLQQDCGDLLWRNLWSLNKIYPSHADLWHGVNYSLTKKSCDPIALTFFFFLFSSIFLFFSFQQLLTVVFSY